MTQDQPDTAELTAPVILLLLTNLRRAQHLLQFCEVQALHPDLHPSQPCEPAARSSQRLHFYYVTWLSPSVLLSISLILSFSPPLLPEARGLTELNARPAGQYPSQETGAGYLLFYWLHEFHVDNLIATASFHQQAPVMMKSIYC